MNIEGESTKDENSNNPPSEEQALLLSDGRLLLMLNIQIAERTTPVATPAQRRALSGEILELVKRRYSSGIRSREDIAALHSVVVSNSNELERLDKGVKNLEERR